MAKEKKTRSLKIMNMHIPYHVIMIIWSFIAVFPLWFLVINTFKVKKEIYTNFFGLPHKWTLDNYKALIQNSDFFAYFRNSFLVVVVSLFMILFLGSLCAFALAHWRTRFSRGVYYFFVIGMMLPIKIATIRLLQIMKVLNTLNSLFGVHPRPARGTVRGGVYGRRGALPYLAAHRAAPDPAGPGHGGHL